MHIHIGSEGQDSEAVISHSSNPVVGRLISLSGP